MFVPFRYDQESAAIEDVHNSDDWAFQPKDGLHLGYQSGMWTGIGRQSLTMLDPTAARVFEFMQNPGIHPATQALSPTGMTL